MSEISLKGKSGKVRLNFLIHLLLKDKRFINIVDTKKLVDLRTKLNSKLPRNLHAKTVCPYTGRGRGIVRFVGVSRFIAKRLIVSCQLPGIKSSSW